MDDMVVIKNFIGGGENLDLHIYFTVDCQSTPYVTNKVIVGAGGTANESSSMGIGTEWSVEVGVHDAVKVRCTAKGCDNAIKWKITFDIHTYLEVRLSWTAFFWSFLVGGEKRGKRDAGSSEVVAYSRCICCDKKAVIEEATTGSHSGSKTGGE